MCVCGCVWVWVCVCARARARACVCVCVYVTHVKEKRVGSLRPRSPKEEVGMRGPLKPDAILSSTVVDEDGIDR